MKRILLFLCLFSLLVSCSTAPEKRDGSGIIDQTVSVSDVLESAEAEASSEPSPSVTPAAVPAETAAPTESVDAETAPTASPDAPEYALHSQSEEITLYQEYDVDLTTLSSTMVYSEVNDMMCYPENYLGKVVKMEGAFAVIEGEERNYYACIIADATACCAQGIEFVPADDLSWPADYPAPDSTVTVAGVFDTYMEGDWLYCQLIDAQIVF